MRASFLPSQQILIRSGKGKKTSYSFMENQRYPHPHIHMIIPAGGLSEDRMEWIASPKKFFLPVKVLSRIFRGILCKKLAEVIDKGDIFLPGDFSWKALKDKLYLKNWNVYAKSLLSGPDRVIEYLGRYTHRVAISNSRILSVGNDQRQKSWWVWYSGCWKRVSFFPGSKA